MEDMNGGGDFSSPVSPTSRSIFALDVSGSTGGRKEYYDLAQFYADEFTLKTKNPDPDPKSKNPDFQQVFLKWDDRCTLSSKVRIEEQCKSKRGGGGTSPSHILYYIMQQQLTNIELWLITDGEIGFCEIDTCCKILQNVSNKIIFTKVKFIVIAPTLDLSVASPFTNNTQCEIIHNDRLVQKVDTQQAFNFDQISLANFQDQIGQLESYITIKYLAQNYDGSQSIKQLTDLRKRLLAEYQKQQQQEQSNSNANSNSGAQKKLDFPKDKHKIVELIQGFIRVVSTDEEKEIDKKLSTLINYIVSKHRDYSGDFLKRHKAVGIASHADVGSMEQPTESSLENYPEIPMTDVVFLADQGKPVLLLNIIENSEVNSPNLIQKLWREKNFGAFHFIESCPLLYNPENLLPLIGHTITLDALQGLQQQSGGSIVNPNNRMESLPLFLHDNREVNQYNDFVLSQLLFEGKKMTNYELWYFVLYKTCRRCEWLNSEAGFMNQLKEYAMARISKGRCRLSLTNYPLDIKNVVPIPIALLFVTEISTSLFHNCPANYKNEKLRGYYSAVEDILKILDHLGYENVDKSLVLKRAETFKLLQQFKQVPHTRDKIRTILTDSWLEEKDGFLTSQSKVKKSNLENHGEHNCLSLQQILYLAANSNTNDMIPLEVPSVASTFLDDYLLVIYRMKPGVMEETVKICPESGKPYFVVDNDTPFYKKVLSKYTDHQVEIDLQESTIRFREKEIKALNFVQVSSWFKWFDELTLANKEYPTVDQFKDFLRKRKFYNDKVFVYPPEIVQDIETFYAQTMAQKDKDVYQNISKIKGSFTIYERIVKEKPEMAKDEILKFIEESKKLVLASC